MLKLASDAEVAEPADAQRSERCEHFARGGSNPLFGTARTWRNRYTRTLEVRIPQGLEVRVLSSALMAVHKLDTRMYVGQKAFINRNEQVLVLRDPNYAKSGTTGLDFPGGKYRWGKDLKEELEREVFEETRLRIKIGRPFTVWTSYKVPGVKARIFLIGHLCQYKSGKVILSDEHNYFEWVDKKNYKKWKESTGFYRALRKYFQVMNGGGT